eukprot:TRINITY_DN46226_c0_g1_i2.p1 TRINITY_DN46226_c0_g1~~TRINITY_DN46226_c0_g1_i2.p1  ORF type:complete len:119 (+),score=17.60 TRINITY_DN46226_c0_g1_i2:58-414(+)
MTHVAAKEARKEAVLRTTSVSTAPANVADHPPVMGIPQSQDTSTSPPVKPVVQSPIYPGLNHVDSVRSGKIKKGNPCKLAVAVGSVFCERHSKQLADIARVIERNLCLLYTSPSPRDS